jgi:hypothetical protein
MMHVREISRNDPCDASSGSNMPCTWRISHCLQDCLGSDAWRRGTRTLQTVHAISTIERCTGLGSTSRCRPMFKPFCAHLGFVSTLAYARGSKGLGLTNGSRLGVGPEPTGPQQNMQAG